MRISRSSRRRTLAFQVRDGVATVYLPPRISDEQARQIVEGKRDWLRQHVEAQRTQQALYSALRPGGEVPFLGEVLPLRLQPGLQVPTRTGPVLALPPEDWLGHLEWWTRQAVQGHYQHRVEHFAGQLGVDAKVRRVLVSSTRSRWGSCAASGDIRLHWLLSRAPLPVLDYVALHEAAHLREMNHSRRYWANVAQVMPDFELHRAWMREHGQALMHSAQPLAPAD
ncbi:M48 family metallopeptidase [Deinococcus sp.]|uniref:M48 family metallopeptidase n=1 Tax=Deinococcus sp. TaxID=47478 RepID=UPI0025BEE7B7|nr:SprT family zinc-dependent metalloprotease [Deinococcus sp.]